MPAAVFTDEVQDPLQILLSILLLVKIDQLGLVRKLWELKIRKLLLDDLVKGFQVPEASVLLVKEPVLDADLHFVLCVGDDTLIVADDCQLDVIH